MEVRNCRMCRRLFNYLGGPNICPACKDELERKFLNVRDYIRENPTATLQEISDATEVSVNQIRDWIREGRLEVTHGSPIQPKCEKCGAPIQKGRFCDNCKTNLANELAGSIAKPAKPDTSQAPKDSGGPKMRFKRME